MRQNQMPELPELDAFAREVKKETGGVIINIHKVKPHAEYTKHIEAMRQQLPLTIIDAASRGKEFAIRCDKGSLLLGMATGAAFHVGALEELQQYPLSKRCNAYFALSDGRAIFILDCNTKQNQVSFSWRQGLQCPFDPARGPHLLSGDLLGHITTQLADEKNEKYFSKATMMDVLLNQSIFNGIGAYSSNEVCYWMYEYTGTRPWANFKHTVVDRGLLQQLVKLVQTYFNFMVDYLKLRPYVPPTKYNEREELSFRAIFLKVYRAQFVTLASGDRVPLVEVTFGLTKAGASHFRITKSRATVFVPSLSQNEIDELPQSWQKKITTPPKEDPLSLFVGAFSWWGQADKIEALKSPQKENINLRPRSEARLLKLPSAGISPVKDISTAAKKTPSGRGAARLGGRARKIALLRKLIGNVF